MQVACTQLGYTSGVHTRGYDLASQEHLTFTFDCSGTEASLEQCPQIPVSHCSSQVTAVCSSSAREICI